MVSGHDEPFGSQLAQKVQGVGYGGVGEHDDRAIGYHAQEVGQHLVAVVHQVSVHVGPTGPSPGLGVGGHEGRRLEAEACGAGPYQVSQQPGMVQVVGPGQSEHRGRREADVQRNPGMVESGLDYTVQPADGGLIRPEAAVRLEGRWSVDSQADTDQERPVGGRHTLGDHREVDEGGGQVIEEAFLVVDQGDRERVDAARTGLETTLGAHLEYERGHAGRIAYLGHGYLDRVSQRGVRHAVPQGQKASPVNGPVELEDQPRLVGSPGDPQVQCQVAVVGDPR